MSDLVSMSEVERDALRRMSYVGRRAPGTAAGKLTVPRLCRGDRVLVILNSANTATVSRYRSDQGAVTGEVVSVNRSTQVPNRYRLVVEVNGRHHLMTLTPGQTLWVV